jgi:hypothetical protein
MTFKLERSFTPTRTLWGVRSYQDNLKAWVLQPQPSETVALNMTISLNLAITITKETHGQRN